MSKENAKAFVQAILNDEELRSKTAGLAPEEVISFAKEMGYDFTLEELKDVKKEDVELSPEELEAAAGGDSKAGRNYIDAHNAYRKMAESMEHCYRDIKGPLHDYIKIGHVEEPILGGCVSWLGDWTNGYDILKCSRCGNENRKKV